MLLLIQTPKTNSKSYSKEAIWFIAVSEQNCHCPLYYDLWYSSDYCSMFLQKWIFVCWYLNLLWSASINSTSLLFSFTKIVLIYEFKKNISKKVNIMRYEWKKFWCFKVYYLAAPLGYYSHINWKRKVENNRSSRCVKTPSVRSSRFSWK